MSRMHKLKTEIEYYEKVLNGEKKFELRFNDRDFKEDDILILYEFDKETQEYTGRSCSRLVLYVLTDAEKFGLKDGFCIMSLL